MSTRETHPPPSSIFSRTQTHIRGVIASHSIRVYDEYLWWEAFASLMDEQVAGASRSSAGRYWSFWLIAWLCDAFWMLCRPQQQRGSMFFFSPMVLLVSATFPSQFYFRSYTECLLIVIFFLSPGYKFRLPAQIGGASGWILGWNAPTRCSSASTSFLFFLSSRVKKKKKSKHWIDDET